MTKHSKLKKDWNDGFACGIGYAVALLWRKEESKLFSEAEYILNESGLKLKDFIDSKVDDYDLDDIKRIFKKLEEVE